MTETPPRYGNAPAVTVTRCPLAIHNPAVQCRVEVVAGGYRCQQTGEVFMVLPMARYQELRAAEQNVGEIKI